MLWLLATCSAENKSFLEHSGGLRSSDERWTLNVASYNLFQRPAWFDALAGESNPECRAAAVGQGLAQFDPPLDFIALQEGLDGALMDALASNANFEHALLNQPASPHVHPGCFDHDGQPWLPPNQSHSAITDECPTRPRNLTHSNGGLALLSRHHLPEISSSLSYPCTPNFDGGSLSWPFCATAWPDTLPNKGLLYAPITIEQNNDKFLVHVITTHLSAATEQVREEQLQTLQTFIEKKFCKGGDVPKEPVLLLGDLNVRQTPDDRVLYEHMLDTLTTSCLQTPRDLLQEYYQEKYETDPPGTMICEGSHIGTCAPPQPKRRLDYIFALEAKNPSDSGWELKVIHARTLELRNTDCAYESNGEVQNSEGRLSDHALVTAQLEWTRPR